jgi:hypothetical protein
MTARGLRGRTFAKGMIAAIGLGLVAWWIVAGLGICPREGEWALECREEASRIGLRAGGLVAGFVAFITAAVALQRRRGPPMSREGGE